MFPSSLRQAWETNRCDYGPWRLARTLTVNKKNMSMDRASAAPWQSRPASVTAAAKLWQGENQRAAKARLVWTYTSMPGIVVVVACLNILNKNTGWTTVNFYLFIKKILGASLDTVNKSLKTEYRLKKAGTAKQSTKICGNNNNEKLFWYRNMFIFCTEVTSHKTI